MKTGVAKWWVLVAMGLITTILSIDATAPNIAVPVMASEFQSSLADMQWVLNIFLLFAAMVQIIGGLWGDSQGHKKCFLQSMILFMISSLGAGFSTSASMLIIFRALQGASIGIATPLSFVLIAEAFPKEMQTFARSFLVVTMGVGLAAGAPLGGLFVHTIGWRWIFYINLPLGLLCTGLAWGFCKATQTIPKRFDFPAILLLAAGLFCITFALNEIESSWFGPSLGLGALLLYGLYRRDRHLSHPVVGFSLFKNRTFVLNNALRIVNQIVFLGLLFFIPLYLQNIALISPVQSGLVLLALTVVMCLIAPFIGKWIDHEGERRANIVAMALQIVGSIPLLFLQSTPNYWVLSTALFINGIAISILYSSTTTGALSVATKETLGRVSGVFLTVAWLACALGISCSGAAIAYASKASVQAALQRDEIVLNEQELVLLHRAGQGLAPISTVEEIPQGTEIAAAAFMRGVHANAWIYLSVCSLGLGLAFLQKRAKS